MLFPGSAIQIIIKCEQMRLMTAIDAINLMAHKDESVMIILGLFDNGLYKRTNKILVLMPHDRLHESPGRGLNAVAEGCEIRAVKDTLALVAHSVGGPKCASAQLFCYPGPSNPALLNWQGVST